MTFLSHKIRFHGAMLTAYLAAEDWLNIGLDDLENDYNISNNWCILILSWQLKQFVNILRLVCICWAIVLPVDS